MLYCNMVESHFRYCISSQHFSNKTLIHKLQTTTNNIICLVFNSKNEKDNTKVLKQCTVKPRFSNTIRSGRLFKNRFFRKPNYIFSLQIIKKRLICFIHQKNNLFTWLHYTRGGQLFWPAGRIAVMEAN